MKKIKITIDEFKQVYMTMTAKEIADKWGISIPYIRKLAKKFGLRRKKEPVKIEFIEEKKDLKEGK
jgi:DNA-binding CsgD family transcriptional regulator